jgi:hypothetical protein
LVCIIILQENYVYVCVIIWAFEYHYLEEGRREGGVSFCPGALKFFWRHWSWQSISDNHFVLLLCILPQRGLLNLCIQIVNLPSIYIYIDRRSVVFPSVELRLILHYSIIKVRSYYHTDVNVILLEYYYTDQFLYLI